MIKNVNNNTRPPNTIEEFIIEQSIRNTYWVYIELFILLIIITLVALYLTYLGFNENIGIIESFLILIFDSTIIFFLSSVGMFLSTTKKIIQNKDISSYTINAGKGHWKIEFEGATVKTKYPISKVNGEKITTVFPETENFPKYNEKLTVEYEYVRLFENAPPFGYNKMFISINGRKFTKKHTNYIKKIKPLGLLSLIGTITFCFMLCFSFAIKFKSTWVSYLCLVLSLIFFRTIYIWYFNKQLCKKFNTEKL